MMNIPYTPKEEKKKHLKGNSQTGGCGDWWRSSQRRRAKLHSMHIAFKAHRLDKTYAYLKALE